MFPSCGVVAHTGFEKLIARVVRVLVTVGGLHAIVRGLERGCLLATSPLSHVHVVVGGVAYCQEREGWCPLRNHPRPPYPKFSWSVELARWSTRVCPSVFWHFKVAKTIICLR